MSLERTPLRTVLAFSLALVWILSSSGCGAPRADPGPDEANPEAVSESVVHIAGDLEIREARAQLFGDMGAAFFTVQNSGEKGDRLLRVEVEGADRVETHETVADGEVMRMESRPDGFEVPAGGTLQLEPGGKHVMVIGPPAVPAGSETLSVLLVFEENGTVEVAAELSGFSLPGAGSVPGSGDS